MEAKKVVVSLVSFVLVVGAVIGVVAVLVHKGDSKSSDNNSSTMSPSMKAVTSVCQPTEFKEACTRTLGEVAKNSSATPKDYVMAAIHATVDEIKKGIKTAGSVRKSVDAAKDPRDDEKIQNCEELLGYALEELDEALKIVVDSEVHTINEKVDTILVWLTAVRAYQTTCTEELDNPQHKSAIENGLANATQLTYNAQAIVYGINDILKSLGINVDLKDVNLPTTSSRRLLQQEGVMEMGHDGYPTWFSASDRKLLAAAGGPRGVRPNAVVAKDGSGQFKTIGAAVAAYPKNNRGRYIIYVKAGIYTEKVILSSQHKNIFIYGDGRGRTIITGSLNFGIMNIGTSNTATFAALGDGFMAKAMTFQNTAGPKGHQAVALRVQSQGAVVFDCSIEGYQDTLYYHTKDQFYKNCAIYGTVDFIFGMGRAMIQDSELIVRRPGPDQSANMVTADGRSKLQEAAGVVIQNCRIFPDKDLFSARFQVATFLGRPWKAWARTVVMESELGDLIRPEGFHIWDSNKPEDKNNHLTCVYREFANRGPGSGTGKRVHWPSYRVIRDKNEALQFSVGRFLPGSNLWLKNAGIPVNFGLTF